MIAGDGQALRVGKGLLELGGELVETHGGLVLRVYSLTPK
jgi:hypothetical protein